MGRLFIINTRIVFFTDSNDNTPSTTYKEIHVSTPKTSTIKEPVDETSTGLVLGSTTYENPTPTNKAAVGTTFEIMTTETGLVMTSFRSKTTKTDIFDTTSSIIFESTQPNTGITTTDTDLPGNSVKTIMLSVFVPISLMLIGVSTILIAKLYTVRKRLNQERSELFALQCVNYDIQDSFL